MLKEIYGTERKTKETKVKIKITGNSVRNEKTGKFEVVDVAIATNKRVYPIGQVVTAYDSEALKSHYKVKLGNDNYDIIPKLSAELVTN